MEKKNFNDCSKKELLKLVQTKYGIYATNDFIKSVLINSLRDEDFFFDSLLRGSNNDTL